MSPRRGICEHGVGQDFSVRRDDAEIGVERAQRTREMPRRAAARGCRTVKSDAARASCLTGPGCECWPRPRGAIGLRDDAHHLMPRSMERLERWNGEIWSAEEHDAKRRDRASPFSRASQLADLLDDEIALDAANPVEKQLAVEVIHLVLKRAREQLRAFDGAHRSPWRSRPRMTARIGRATVALKPGTLRQPSSSSCIPSSSTNSGLTNTIRSSGLRPSDRSTTKIRSDTPICGAARPMPGAAYIVSIMSSMSFWMSRVSSPTSAARAVQRRLAELQNRANHDRRVVNLACSRSVAVA